jgi:hypothetical protein
MAPFKQFVLADLSGVVVHDRYHNCDAADLGRRGHRLCAAHLIRDLEDCAETYPRSPVHRAQTRPMTVLRDPLLGNPWLPTRRNHGLTLRQ